MKKFLCKLCGLGICLASANVVAAPLNYESKPTRVVACEQKPGGCHMECGLQECTNVCVQGVKLEVYKNQNSIFDASISTYDAVTGELEFNEVMSGFSVKKAEVAPGRYGHIELSLKGKLLNPNNTRLRNRDIEQGLSFEVTPKAPNTMFSFYHAYVGCDYSKVGPGNCYYSPTPVSMIGDTEYGYVITGRFECQLIDKVELGIQY